VVGRVFWIEALDALIADDGIRPALRSLEERGLVLLRPASRTRGLTEIAFHHGLMRDVAYQSIPRASRARLHAAVAEWIEGLAADRRLEFIDLIAHHLESAANPEDASLAWPEDPARRRDLAARAAGALIEAGKAARGRYAIDQAIAFGERALSLAGTEGERVSALELKARAAHAGVRADDGLRWYQEAISLSHDAGTRSRLRANATLLWSRYAGAFTGDDWKQRAAEILEDGLREVDEDRISFERGALLVGHASAVHWGIPRHTAGDVDPVADAERAIEIAEAIGSTELLSYAVDTLSAVAERIGFCRSEWMAEQALRAARRIADPVESHELLVNAAADFCRAGRFDAAEVADEAARQAARLGPHHRIHAAFAQTVRSLPTGRLRELAEATANVPELVAEEGGHMCGLGVIAFTGRIVARLEMDDVSGAQEDLAWLDAASPAISIASRQPLFFMLEHLRVLLGADEAIRRMETIKESASATERISRLRAQIPLRALVADWARLATLEEQARELAEPFCAPVLGWLAEWAAGVRLAAHNDPTEGLKLMLEATSRLDAFGEHYTAACLLRDALAFLTPEAAGSVADDLVRRLAAMGAHYSASAVDGPTA
jgi:hypothetical protein